MKMLALFLTITTSTILACGPTKKTPTTSKDVQTGGTSPETSATVEDVKSENPNDAIVAGDIEQLCRKALTFSPEDRVVKPGECKEKMNALKEKNQPLFAEVVKCVSEANDQAAMEFCNSHENPRYQSFE